MSLSIIGVNDAKAVKRNSAVLFVDKTRESYYGNRMVGRGAEANAPIIALTDLEKQAGDRITYDLSLQLKNSPVYGEGRITGTEELLKSATDSILIDLVGKSVSGGRRMTQKRTIHDLRSVARNRQRDFWSRWEDEMLSMYLSGARGVNADFVENTSFTGFAGNALKAPDSEHNLFATGATAFNDITSADIFDLRLIDRAVTKAKVMGGGSTNIPEIRPMMIGGEKHYVVVMHPFQEHDLRVNTSTGQWLDIQKAAAGADGQKNPIFRGSMGKYRGAVLHCADVAILFDNAGSGTDQPAARALFMGRQAGVIAWGSPGDGFRYKWREDLEDRGRELIVTVETMVGVKKCAFENPDTGVNHDFGVIALDTYAADPNA